MLIAYIDDSGMGQPPVSVLAGWMDDSARWALFSDDWKQSLEMRPRLEYFKYSEAMSFSGQFSGWSEQSRNERVKRFMAILVEYQPFGIASAMPHDLYQEVFGDNADKIVRYPYFFSFYSVVVGVTQHLAKIGRIEQIDFIFDIQPGQIDAILESWKRLLEVAPPEVRPIIGDYPIFRSDKSTMPLQAADLCAGYQREAAASTLLGREQKPPVWGDMSAQLRCVGRFWTREMLTDMMNNMLAKRAAASDGRSS